LCWRLIRPLYTSGFIVAPPNSGKTHLLYNIIANCAGPETVVIVFCPTVYEDKSWLKLTKWMDEEGIPYVAYEDFKTEDGVNLVQTFMDEYAQQAKRDQEKKEEREGKKEQFIGGGWGRGAKYFKGGEKEKEFLPTIDDYLVKVDGVTYQYPPYIIIFDDMSEAMRDKYVARLVKKARHHRSKVFFSTQQWTDLNPGTRSSIKNWITFKGIGDGTMKAIHNACGTPLGFEPFLKLYRDATKEPHAFLHYDKGSRKTFGSTSKEYIELPLPME
jgi:hypothetical protein